MLARVPGVGSKDPRAGGDGTPGRARPWKLGAEDVFRVSRFSLAVGRELRLDLGPADLGIGHCADGALWAVLIPRQSGSLTSQAARAAEKPAHVWLRFHPKEIGRLFPQETLSVDGAEGLRPEMCAIANLKMMSSWSVEGRATIPDPGQMTVDVDTIDGPRRLFAVDTQAGTARYAPEFQECSLDMSPEAVKLMSELLLDHRQAVAKQSRDTFRPKVVSVQPAPGAIGVPPMTELRLRFDRPMDPLGLKLGWESGGCKASDFPRYDSNRFEFTIPMHLAPGVLHQIVVNTEDPGFPDAGFLSAASKRASLYVWRFVTQRAPQGLETAPMAATAG